MEEYIVSIFRVGDGCTMLSRNTLVSARLYGVISQKATQYHFNPATPLHATSIILPCIKVSKQESGEDFVTRRVMICASHRILVG
jgi:hypothetical protein